MSHIDGDFLYGSVSNLDPEVHRHLIKLLLVLDLKTGDFTFGCSQKDLGHATGMIGVGRSTYRHHSGKVTGRDSLRRCTTKAHSSRFLCGGFSFLFWSGNTTGPHGTVFTTTFLCSDGAGFHGFGPIKDGFTSIGLCLLQHMNGCGIDTLLFQIGHVSLLNNPPLPPLRKGGWMGLGLIISSSTQRSSHEPV